MIEHTNLISDDNGYKSFNHFKIHDTFKEMLFDDYFNYNTNEYNKRELAEDLYNKNFVNKYDPIEHKQIFDMYINNEKFKQKALFIYSLINEAKYTAFVQNNPEIDNPNELTIVYSVLDSDGVKVQIYNISIADIAFLF